MEIKRIAYPVLSLGPGERVAIWTVGCNHHCKGCIAQNLQNSDETYRTSLSDITAQIERYQTLNPNLGVTISGGEPFLQSDLQALLKAIHDMGIEDVLVYTGYTYEELLSLFPDFQRDFKPYIGVLVDGRYVEELNDNKPLRGSSNQRIIFLKESLIDKYNGELEGQRKFTVDTNADGTLDIYGIPPKGFLADMQKKCLKKGILYAHPKK